MIKTKITCQDKYEAQKLASLIYVKNGNETFITEIIDIFDNEVVFSIKDKSAHSILLKNKTQVELFTDFIQSIIEKEQKIIDITTNEDKVEIFKE
ncbi:MAG: hypothetical protein MKZ80_04060 [Candidatus Nitrosopelagicus sp.]|nr:hypothetical protein [Candidatus Nitrosopelagicus sp.]